MKLGRRGRLKNSRQTPHLGLGVEASVYMVTSRSAVRERLLTIQKHILPEDSVSPENIICDTMDDSKLSKVDSAIGQSPKDIEARAYVLEKANAEFELQDIVLDEVRSDEYLIEMKFSGICTFYSQDGVLERNIANNEQVIQ